jgi:hypothetical protein
MGSDLEGQHLAFDLAAEIVEGRFRIGETKQDIQRTNDNL